MRSALIIMAAMGGFLASPSVAETQLPKGCTAYLTVQSRGCNISHHYTCTGDPKGHQWALYINNDGPVYVSQIDHETRWIYSVSMYTRVESRLIEDAKDHASLTTLLQTGYDDFDFKTQESDGAIEHVRGFDRLIQDTIVIDDHPLMIVESEVTTTDKNGDLIWAVKGPIFVDPNNRFFLSGVDIWTYPNSDPVETNETPVEFIHPGEPGFLADTPKYDCNAELVKFTPN